MTLQETFANFRPVLGNKYHLLIIDKLKRLNFLRQRKTMQQDADNTEEYIKKLIEEEIKKGFTIKKAK